MTTVQCIELFSNPMDQYSPPVVNIKLLDKCTELNGVSVYFHISFIDSLESRLHLEEQSDLALHFLNCRE